MTDRYKTTNNTVPPIPAAASDVAAAVHAILPLHGSTIGTPAPGEIAFLPDGISAHSLKSLYDEWQEYPKRRTGVAAAEDIESLCALINRHKDADSVVFARMNENDPSFTAVMDYHRAGPPTTEQAARWCRHHIVHKPVISEVWKAWQKVDGKPLSQPDLAALLEDRILDIAPPLPDAEMANSPLIAALGGRPATQQDLLTASRGMRIRENAEVTNAQVLETGEVEIVYRTELRDAGGQPLRLPTCFAIQAPVYEGGPAYRLWMRIRFRRAEGAIIWTLARWRPDLIIRDALNEMREQIAEDTALPVYAGTREQ